MYYQRLLTSTMGWKDEELGAYVRLLIYQFDNGSIPNDMDAIARIAPTAKKNWKLIGQKFIEKDGAFINLVMDGIRQQRIKSNDANRKNGEKGGRPNRVMSDQLRVYVIECFNSEERFYKVGVTEQTITGRFSSRSGPSAAIPYSFSVVLDVVCNFQTALSIEKQVNEEFQQYSPRIPFSGSKECYLINHDIIKMITEWVNKNNPPGLKNERQPNMVTGLLDSVYSEGGMGETEFAGNWDSVKAQFLQHTEWVTTFCTRKGLSLQQFDLIASDFAGDTELREDYKTLKDLRSHFTNWFNKGKDKILADLPAKKNGLSAREIEEKKNKEKLGIND